MTKFYFRSCIFFNSLQLKTNIFFIPNIIQQYLTTSLLNTKLSDTFK